MAASQRPLLIISQLMHLSQKTVVQVSPLICMLGETNVQFSDRFLFYSRKID